MTQPFHSLSTETVFIWHQVQYKKIADERISCCKVLNAIRLDNNEKIMIPPIENVEVSTDEK